AALLDRLGSPGALEGLSSQGRCCLLWAVARLSASPPWLLKLMQLCADSAPSFSGHQLATALHALARLDAARAGLSAAREPQTLLEALHQELRRRQKSLGPGATSAMDTVLMADALAKLQVRDDALFASLATALRSFLTGGELGIREVRHASAAFSSLGFVDARLASAICVWLAPRTASCSSNDLAALAFALARSGAAGGTHEKLFEALGPEVLSRVKRGELGARDAASLIFSFWQAGALPPSAALPSSDERWEL
ncbi:unnamed protein product, partial [Polarella glacialis]